MASYRASLACKLQDRHTNVHIAHDEKEDGHWGERPMPYHDDLLSQREEMFVQGKNCGYGSHRVRRVSSLARRMSQQQPTESRARHIVSC